MKIRRAYRTELDPNDKQRIHLLKHAGAARWAYNWGLRQKIDAYKATGKSPSYVDLSRQINALKKIPKEDGGVPWMCEISSYAPLCALRDLDVAYKNFFRRCKNQEVRKGFPLFKKRRYDNGSFRLYRSITVRESWIQLPRLGRILLKEHGYIPTEDVKIVSATVSQRAGRWFVSVQVEEEIADLPTKAEHVVGVDVGARKLAVTSDNQVFKNPKELAKAQRRLAYLQRSVSRKKKGSKNRRKAVQKLQRQHYRISNVRKDAIHKATTAIAKRATMIVIENLNVRGMKQNRRVARSIADTAMYEFHRQLDYKSKWYGVDLVVADRFFPSSKTCSSCGHVKEDLFAEETYHCDVCGLIIDRDLNAALNLKALAASSAVTACGEDVSPSRGRRPASMAASAKQEPSTGLHA